MSSTPRGLLVALVTSLLLAATAAGADPVRVVASDDRGITLRLDVPDALPREIAPDGRSRLRVPGLDLTSATGYPRLPFATALVALPPGARPSVRVIEFGAETALDIELERGPRAVFRPDPQTGDFLPDWEPAAPEGAAIWPQAPAELGDPFILRRQTLVRVTLYPWQYDARARRLTQRSSLTVRVSFGAPAVTPLAAGIPAAADPAADALFGGAVINAEAGRAWRRPRESAVPRSGVDRLFGPGARAQGGAPFDESEPEVRVLLDSTAVYALDFDALAAAGYPAAVPVAEVSVHRHEYLEDAAVPYQTIEMPIEVLDANANNTFDSGDRIVMWAQNWAERSGATIPQRTWGSGEVVFATRVRAPLAGLRVPSRSGWRAAVGLTPPTWFPHLEHYERDLDYFNAGSSFADTIYDAFHWTVQAPYYLRDESVTFEVNHLDTSQTAQVTLSWQGRSPDTHWNWAQVRNASGVYTTVVDSVGWSGRLSLTVGSTVFGSALSEGANNRLRLWGKTFFGPPDPTTNSRSQAGLNWLEIRYAHRYRPIRGLLVCNSGTLAGEYELLAQGFTNAAAIRVYDVTDPAAPVRLTGVQIQPNGGTFDVRLQDSTATGVRRTYAIFEQGRSPLAGNVTAVTRYGIHTAVSGDYLLIVPEVFRAAMDPLIQLRQSQGLSVVVAPLEGLFDEFGGGRRSSHAIKRFVRYGYRQWNTRFVMLVGDGSEDPRKVDPLSGTDWVPVHRVYGPVLVSSTGGSFYEGVPSDPWYGWCVDCPDPSLQPKVPEVFVGRLPVNSLAQAQAVVAKLVAYEQPQADESWRRRMTLMSDDAYSGESFFSGGGGSSNYCRKSYEEVFEEINDIIRNLVLGEAGLTQSEPEVFNLSAYLQTTLADMTPCAQPPPPSTDTCRCRRPDFETRARATATPALMTRLNEGRLWWNYQGHANERVQSHESFYINQPTRDDKDLLLNDGRLFLYSGFSCHPNAFAHFQELGARWGTPSYGEDLVTLPARGAIASWGSTGYELLPLSATTHLNVHFARALFANPLREPYASGHPTIGEAVGTALLNNVRNVPPPSSFENQVGITYTLLGDPATRFSLGPPQAAVTANTQPVTSGQPLRLRIGRDSLVVEADIATNARVDSLALLHISPAGATTVIAPARYTVTPAFPDTSPASGRGRRYRLSFRDSLVADSYRYILRTVDQGGGVNPFAIVLVFETVLLADGAALSDLDVVSPNAAFTMRVLSPAALDPAADLTLRVGGQVQGFSFTPDNGDTSGREWLLSWTHAPYPFGETSVELSAVNGATRIHRFQVNVLGAELRIQNPLAFPNPFEDDLGTHFSFTLESASATDVRIRVYTVSGRMLYERRESGLAPGYHQIAWDGRDAEGDKLANGIYVYRITARNASTTATVLGRLAKLRKPRRVEEDLTATP